MNLATKNRLHNKTITNLVRLHFGDDCEIDKVEELKEGMFNTAYLIVCQIKGKEEALVLKVAASRSAKVLTYERDIMKTELDVMFMLHEKTTIPMPVIRGVASIDNELGCRYFFMTKLNGVPLNQVMNKMESDNLKEIKMAIGDLMAQMHKIKGLYFGYFQNRTGVSFTTWKEAYLDFMNNILADGVSGGIKLPYLRINKVLNNNSRYLDDVSESVLVNFDLWPGNIFVEEKEGKYQIEGVIDFERSFWGDPLAEIPSTVMMFKDLRANLCDDVTLWKKYCELMKRPTQLTKSEKSRINLYYLYLYIIMIVETYRYSRVYAFLQRTYAWSRMKKTLRLLEKD